MEKKIMKTSTVLSMIGLLFFVAVPMVSATVEPGVTTNPCPPGYGFIDFEEGTDGVQIVSQIPGVQFTTTSGYNWLYADVRTGNYNLRSLTDPYNYGSYVTNGFFCAWLGVSGDQGRIDFTEGTASYFSVLTSTYSGLSLDAYDSGGNFLATSGWASGNLYTYTFTRLTVEAPGMAYVIVHDTGNYWEIDDIVTDAPGVGNIAVEVDIKPGSYPSSINLKDKGVTPVAIHTTEDFDATTVDPETVELEGVAAVKWEIYDCDEVWDPILGEMVGDGDLDLVLYFDTQALVGVLSPGDTEATLTGQTFGGVNIEGTGDVRIVVQGKP